MPKVSHLYMLTWISAPRPPRHPREMTGRQTFREFDGAIKHMRGLAPDAKFVSLEMITTRTEDVSEMARTTLSKGEADASQS